MNKKHFSVENNKRSLDSAHGQQDRGSRPFSGSPYLARPTRSLADAIEQLGHDRYGDLLACPETVAPADTSGETKTGVLVRLSVSTVGQRAAVVLEERLSKTQPEGSVVPLKVANLK